MRERWAAELAAWRRTPAPATHPAASRSPKPRSASARALDDHRFRVADAGRNRRETGQYPRSFVQGYADPDASGRPLEPWAVLVAHDGIFRVLVLTLFGLPLERFWSFPFNLCAITVVALQDGVPVLRAHNLSEHLAPLAAEARAAAEARGDRRGAL